MYICIYIYIFNSLSLSVAVTHSLSLFLSLSFSFSLSLCIFLPFSPLFSLSFSLSLSLSPSPSLSLYIWTHIYQTFNSAKDSTPLKFRHGGDGLNLRKSDQSDPKSNAIGSKSDVNSNGRRAVKAKVIDLTDD